MRLELRAPLFGIENVARFAVGTDRHLFEGDVGFELRVGGEEDGRHAAAAQFPLNDVPADLLKDGRHRRDFFAAGAG